MGFRVMSVRCRVLLLTGPIPEKKKSYPSLVGLRVINKRNKSRSRFQRPMCVRIEAFVAMIRLPVHTNRHTDQPLETSIQIDIWKRTRQGHFGVMVVGGGAPPQAGVPHTPLSRATSPQRRRQTLGPLYLKAHEGPCRVRFPNPP